MKTGRNTLCGCGSGTKYKKCCLNREKDNPVNLWEVLKATKQAFEKKYCYAADCYKDECTGRIVKAHSVSKSSNLKKIARDGHVYAVIPSSENFTKHKGVLHPELLGINKASTFTGFCEFHDKKIFSPIENKYFTGENEQVFLLAYRAQARESYMKLCQADALDLLKDVGKGKPIDEQIRIRTMNHFYGKGVKAGVRDAKIYKEKYENILISENYSAVKAYIIFFKKTPSVLCSAGIFPECDFHGNSLQNVFDLEVTNDLITFSSIATNEGGAVVFSWLEDEDNKFFCQKFIESLLNIEPDFLSTSLIRFFFEFCENVFLEPNWWEGLEPKKKDYLINRMASRGDLDSPRPMKCLENDGYSFDDWEYKGIEIIN